MRLLPRAITTSVLTLTSLLVLTSTALAFQEYAGTFMDDDGDVHEANIEAISDENITDGCNPPDNDEYCPDGDVTRGQMAKFIVRAFELPATDTDYFTDDDDSEFEADINALREAGVTDGCNPPDNDEFCPEDAITRGEMAKFLVRALERPLTDAEEDYFTDDDDSIFEANIDELRNAGVTKGCNPPENDEYCPESNVTRAEMASFLARARELSHEDPTPFGNETCDAAYSPCVPTVEETGDLDCDDITKHYPDGVKHDNAFGDPHKLNTDGDDEACEA